MSIIDRNLTIIIPTYKRQHLLAILLEDLCKQDILPDQIVIVDGAPEEKGVANLLACKCKTHFRNTVYIPSNHANAPFQRYLGTVVAKEHELILLIDDDIRIQNRSSIRKMISPFVCSNSNVVGLSPHFDFPARETYQTMNNSRCMPGSITPVGDRIPPSFSGDYLSVDWLRGGVMLYRTKAILQEIFNTDVFAISHIQCGLGADDTFLSRAVGKHGKLIYARCVTVQHPDTDDSKVFPKDHFQLGVARAYSRRFLNDHYRISEPPHFSDRIALLKSYVGNNLLNYCRAMAHLEKYRFAYAFGYLMGSIRGIFKKPTAINLTPNIDWQKDADEALSRQIIIS